jgi:hypothetical protein
MPKEDPKRAITQPAVAFRNIARNRHGSPSQLRTETKRFFLGKSLAEDVQLSRKHHRALPYKKIAEVTGSQISAPRSEIEICERA